MKAILRLLFFALILGGMVIISSCDEDLEDTLNCTGCGDDAPYGVVGGSSCYSTVSACESAESGNCVICQ